MGKVYLLKLSIKKVCKVTNTAEKLLVMSLVRYGKGDNFWFLSMLRNRLLGGL